MNENDNFILDKLTNYEKKQKNLKHYVSEHNDKLLEQINKMHDEMSLIATKDERNSAKHPSLKNPEYRRVNESVEELTEEINRTAEIANFGLDLEIKRTKERSLEDSDEQKAVLEVNQEENLETEVVYMETKENDDVAERKITQDKPKKENKSSKKNVSNRSSGTVIKVDQNKMTSLRKSIKAKKNKEEISLEKNVGTLESEILEKLLVYF